MDIYAQNIMDHYKNPRNWGRLKGALTKHSESNRSCGDILYIDVEIQDDAVKNFTFTGEGCSISLAATSILGEYVIGKKTDDILKMNFKEVQKILGIEISQRREKCAALCLLSIQNTLLKSGKKKLKDFSDIL